MTQLRNDTVTFAVDQRPLQTRRVDGMDENLAFLQKQVEEAHFRLTSDFKQEIL